MWAYFVLSCTRFPKTLKIYIFFQLQEKKDMALVTYTVKTSKGKKNVVILTTKRPMLGKTKDDGKEKPAIFKYYDFTKGGNIYNKSYEIQQVVEKIQVRISFCTVTKNIVYVIT